MTGYTRQAAANMVTDATIFASDLNAEFNQMQTAMDGTTGHTHDGSTGSGPKLTLTSSVTGVLPVANGGSGSATFIHTHDGTAGSGGILPAFADIAGTGTVGGTANAITLTTNAAIPLLANTIYLTFKALYTNTGPVTLTVNALATSSLKTITSVGEVELAAGQIVQNGIYTVRYDTAANVVSTVALGAFIVLNPTDIPAYNIGDFKDTVRSLDSTWLRRDGSIYLSATYPILAPYMRPQPGAITWTNRFSASMATGLNDITYGAGLFVAVGQDTTGTFGAIRTSPDGITWTSRTGDSQRPLFGVTYGNGQFVAVGNSGSTGDSVILRSTNGITWTPVIISTTFLRGIAYGAGLFVAIGEGNIQGFPTKIYTSPDGITWTSRTNPSASGATFGWIKFDGQSFIATNRGGSVSVIYRSTDGINWTNLSTGSIGLINGLNLGDGSSTKRFVITDQYNGLVYYLNASGVIQPTSYKLDGIYLQTAYSTGSGFVAVGNQASSSGNLTGTLWAQQAIPNNVSYQAVVADPNTVGRFIAVGGLGSIVDGQQGTSSSFSTPSDNPSYGWIKATN